MKTLTLLLCAWMLAGYADAAETALDRLLKARSLKCVFTTGTYTEWETGQPVTKTTTGLLEFHFDSIDYRKGSARFIANRGAGDVRTFATARGAHFMETPAIGNPNHTTVFSWEVPGEGFAAVTSRHVGSFMATSPFPSQYHGVCKVWQ